MCFEITYLHPDGSRPAHTADAQEIRSLVAWASRTGVGVRVRPVTVPTTPRDGSGDNPAVPVMSEEGNPS
ncbi:hypothetical protein [Streptomyces albireticuli]|uniref:Uncharacterized protein n=1 Tax=Streptomyces albireticuli TaxID=1940 RepID=A0A2A2D5A3_9ACTN|nr:hypothetical protein [Streptomyces albireticuli]MCD9195179.1 hypothetical protein [Streptomyces albireticuli]PAU46626.1 hypothetical protein CK936_23100 [Streptomyces albireticuli]